MLHGSKAAASVLGVPDGTAGRVVFSAQLESNNNSASARTIKTYHSRTRPRAGTKLELNGSGFPPREKADAKTRAIGPDYFFFLPLAFLAGFLAPFLVAFFAALAGFAFFLRFWPPTARLARDTSPAESRKYR